MPMEGDKGEADKELTLKRHARTRSNGDKLDTFRFWKISKNLSENREAGERNR